ncbi:hypothetical protein BW723_10875 [Polaribacter reichenbachii]|uniref:Uncharacterized protein n=1 Tax=Polaribacter reichenbachii TaxID=996801 RepID=A0A1B8TQI5_9FLAO|nr:hypothetical protein [Polaribacter reichenbachii]APZ46754.1 hypothetical protein BW723_10875 [Polaribacter reichenbachii]AUC17397.1 hypothetical protein BTO17_01320 [Polaribacter reichenbachii]OBY61728.1 hypothetical protein LPB301_16885 [Polaribacter reichenbachii]
MEYNIIASPLANSTYLQNIDYLEMHWSEKEVINFITKVSDIIIILKLSPETFKKWEKDKTIHKVEVLKQITLYYQIATKDVELLLFFNNLQDPNKLNEFLQ